MTAPSAALLDAVVDRVGRPDFRKFEAQLRSSGFCEKPVLLAGRIEVCDGGDTRHAVWSTDGEPDQVLRKACGNRREAVCKPCSERYRGDAWQLIAAGLRGGKGIPESVAGHPTLFVSLTAPSFGVVHSQRRTTKGEPGRCRPRRGNECCPHGVPLGCSKRHEPDDPCLGEPLCRECFDYRGAVLWNNVMSELWRRTMIYLPRELAAILGWTQKRLHEEVRVSYIKVAEYQARGLVHVHALIRLDRRMPAYRADEVHAPGRRFTADLLEEALRAAADNVSAPTPEQLGGPPARWGEQLDVQRLDGNAEERGRRASYLAKYSTKGTEQAGGLPYRVRRDGLDRLPVRDHVRDLVAQAFDLADEDTEGTRRLGACAHMFGYRGHCLSKSRRWSTTFKALREAREQHVREQLGKHGADAAQRALAEIEPEDRVGTFAFVGRGHLTSADAYLAAQAAASARERREAGREARYDHHNRGGRTRWQQTPHEVMVA
ncbi:MAG: hypothetical protein Q8O56_03565 [Solirubrobacteraceae bacterium]|nr:hypothetical protein [Solirubrobacteraceae bacterium]